MRGEDIPARTRRYSISGSPPRAWGGLNPRRVPRLDLAHPHVRGEDHARKARASHADGSPPRAWGGHATFLRGMYDMRLTPTCVGRTSGSAPFGRGSAAHPHVRGEDVYLAAPESMTNGSPPRAWGGRLVIKDDATGARLTPTCVGRTGSGRRRRPSTPAHPHVRGEDWGVTLFSGQMSGSPPRAWGGLQDDIAELRGERLTPTCVGRTTSIRGWAGAGAAHPHVRGEDGPFVLSF